VAIEIVGDETGPRATRRKKGVIRSRLLVDFPEWTKTWDCEACGLRIPADMTLKLPSGHEYVCGRCFMLKGVNPGNVEDRATRPSSGVLDGTKRTLYDYQRDGVRFLASRRIALIQDATGVGKTPQLLRAIPEGFGLCLVATKSLTRNWQKEVREWRPELLTLDLDRDKWTPGGPNFATYRTYDWIRGLTRIVKPKGPIVLVLDEAQKAKNPDKKTCQAIRVLRDVVLETGGYVWLSTATPWENNPMELWSVWQNALLGFAAFPQTGWAEFDAMFEDWYNLKERDERAPPSGSKLKQLFDRIGHVGPDPGPTAIRIRRLQDVIPDLPEKRYQQVEVEITKEDASQLTLATKKLVAHAKAWEAVRSGLIKNPEEKSLNEDQRAKRYEHLEAHAEHIFSELKEPSPAEARKAIDLALKWKKLSPGQRVLMEVRKALATAKIPGLLELVERYEEHGEPVVVFSAHRAPVDILGSRRRWATIQGKTSDAARQKAIDRFQAGDLLGIALTIDSGGVGITLHRARYAIRVDREWTPGVNKQSENRIYRFGQLQDVTIIDLFADHALDERVEEVNLEKVGLIAAVDGEVG